MSWAVNFLLLAITAAYFGFFALTGMAAVIVQMLFIAALILFAASELMSLLRDEPPL